MFGSDGRVTVGRLASAVALAALLPGVASCSRGAVIDSGGCVRDHIVAYDAVATGPGDLALRARLTSNGKPVVGETVMFYLSDEQGAPAVESTAGQTDANGVAIGRMSQIDVQSSYFRNKVLSAKLFDAKYEKSVFRAQDPNPYCDNSDSAKITFR
jgi:hypothetical protein